MGIFKRIVGRLWLLACEIDTPRRNAWFAFIFGMKVNHVEFNFDGGQRSLGFNRCVELWKPCKLDLSRWGKLWGYHADVSHWVKGAFQLVILGSAAVIVNVVCHILILYTVLLRSSTVCCSPLQYTYLYLHFPNILLIIYLNTSLVTIKS